MQDITLIRSTVKLPLLNLPVCSPVVDLNGVKIIISPGSQVSDQDYQKLDGITDLIAPNLLHSAGIKKALDKFPVANVWGAPGIKKLKPHINWHSEIDTKNWPFSSELQAYMIEGAPALNEIVFYHKKSKTLIVTDLCFNMTQITGLGALVLLNIFGTYRRFAISRLMHMFVKDQQAFGDSIRSLMNLDFENLIVGHGEPVLKNAKSRLAEAFLERGFKL